MDPSDAHVLQRAGSHIHYWTTGPTDGPLVAFTHGATLDHEMFEPQRAALAAAGYRVLTWDMRGHGLSKPMGQPFGLEVAADDLVAIVDELGRDTATFVGQSFGGFVSQEIAFRHPERVRALVLIGCTDLSREPSRMMQIASTLLPRLLPWFSIESFRRRTVQDLSTRADVKRYGYAATGRLSKAEFVTVIMAGVTCLASGSRYGSDYTIRRPFLLTHGDHDRANRGVYPRQSPSWAAKEPNCTYKTVPDAGHTANLDNPEAFNEMLLEFLDNHAGTGPPGP
jgi:pimeloyl-ACP methyl ester carboxylesterase